MTEIQIAIEATKLAIIDLILTDFPALQEAVELIIETDIQPYMSSESTETE